MSPRNKFDLSLIAEAPDLCFEIALWEQGVHLVAGIDEAGRGALAGPVSAGVVILPADPDVAGWLSGVRDSKQMRPSARDHWADRIQNIAITCSVGFASNQEIDELGIVPAVRLAVQRAIAELSVLPQHLLVDFLALPNIPIPQTALIRGDARVLSVAAASVLAKTARDAQMLELDASYPQYGFSRNKGYGTPQHCAAIREYGQSSFHRTSFTLRTNRASKKRKQRQD